jgi:hypothetical protein
LGSILDLLPREGAVFAGRTGAVPLPGGRFLLVEPGAARIVDAVAEPVDNQVPAPGADLRVRRPGYMSAYADILAPPAVPKDRSPSAAFKRIWPRRDEPDRYVRNDPYTGGLIRVCQAVRRLVPAEPLALSCHLQFGDPEDPEVAYQLEKAVQGIADAARMFRLPVVAGELTTGRGVGLHPCVAVHAHTSEQPAPAEPGPAIAVVGRMTNDLSGSLLLGDVEGFPPPIDLVAESRALEVVRAIGGGLPIERGGLLIALARCCAQAQLGARLTLPPAWRDLSPEVVLFGEAQSRFLVALPEHRMPELRALAEPLNVPVEPIGAFGGAKLTVDGLIELDLADLA